MTIDISVFWLEIFIIKLDISSFPSSIFSLVNVFTFLRHNFLLNTVFLTV